MKKALWLFILFLSLFLSACSDEPNATEDATTVVITPATEESTEPILLVDPEWFGENVIDEAISCLFPLEGEMNIPLAQELLLPLVEAGNAEAQYYWGYIYDCAVVDNNGNSEKEALYWYELAMDQGFAKAYLATALNTHIESEERANELVELARQTGLFEMEPKELGADGCAYIGLYYAGTKDYSASLNWFSKASELGSTVGMYYIGQMYYEGIGVEKNIVTALDWFLKAAHLGNAYAMSQAGYIYMENVHELIDSIYADSVNEYQKNADAGDTIAMCNLSQLYEYGLGGLEWDSRAVYDWYLKAANLGDTYAMYKLGNAYEFGNYGLTVNYNTAIDWYLKAAEQGYLDALYRLGNAYEYGYCGLAVNYSTAIDWYLKAAELGNPYAMESLCVMYSQGLGVDQDSVKALEWFQKSEEQKKTPPNNGGYIDCYSDRSLYQGVAIEWFQKAADAGLAVAMNNIGVYGYDEYPYYISRDDGEAKAWYVKAASEGAFYAMANLGYSYYRSEEYNSAMKWFINAYVKGADYVADDINDMLIKKQGVNAYFENYGELISPSS